jgi:hypothetical protein
MARSCTRGANILARLWWFLGSITEVKEWLMNNILGIPEKVPTGIDSQVPLAHCIERRHLLDIVRVEMLQLEAALEEDSVGEPPSGDVEVVLVEGHERDHEPLMRARHELVTGHLPLHGGGEWRELTRLDEMK